MGTYTRIFRVHYESSRVSNQGSLSKAKLRKEYGTKRQTVKTPQNTGSNAKNTRIPPPPTLQAIQVLFSSNSVPNQHPNKPEKPAKQRNNR